MSGNVKSDIYMATPSMSGDLWSGYVRSWLATMILFANNNLSVEHDVLCGCSNVAVARCLLAQNFLDSDCHTMLCIDADLGWKSEEALRLVQSPHEVVCGVYPAKVEYEKWPADWKPGQTRLLEAGMGIPGGFVKIKRSALEKMAKQFPELLCTYNDGRPINGFFLDGIFEGQLMSEDYAFCQRWKQCGEKAFIDPDMTFEHRGMKTWSGNLAKSLKARDRAAA
jgi:hypothetical protein